MKKGITTSELWLTLAYALLTALVGVGLLELTEYEKIKAIITPLIVAALPVAMYTYSRMKIKSQ